MELRDGNIESFEQLAALIERFLEIGGLMLSVHTSQSDTAQNREVALAACRHYERLRAADPDKTRPPAPLVFEHENPLVALEKIMRLCKKQAFS